MVPIEPDNLETLRRSFSEVDFNQDGYISKDELSQAIDNVGQIISEQELDRMYELVDKDGNGLLDFEEFMELMEGNCLCQSKDKEVEQLFRIIDIDNKGYITEEELTSMLKKLGENVRKKDVRKMIELGDKNKDKRLCLEEFKDMISTDKYMKIQ